MKVQPFMHESTSSSKLAPGTNKSSASSTRKTDDFFDSFKQASKRLNQERAEKKLSNQTAQSKRNSDQVERSLQEKDRVKEASAKKTAETLDSVEQLPVKDKELGAGKSDGLVAVEQLPVKDKELGVGESDGFVAVPVDSMAAIQIEKPDITQDQVVFNPQLQTETPHQETAPVQNIAIENLNPPTEIKNPISMDQLKQGAVQTLNLERDLLAQGKQFPPIEVGDAIKDEAAVTTMSKIAEDSFFSKEKEVIPFKEIQEGNTKIKKESVWDKKAAGFHFASRPEITEGVELQVEDPAKKEIGKINNLMQSPPKEDLEMPKVENGAEQRKFQTEMMLAGKGIEEGLKVETSEAAQKATHIAEKLDTQDITGKVRLMLNAKKSEMLMQLKPEHLGKLEFRLIKQGDQMSAQIAVGSNAAREMLESQMAQLHKGLENQGIQLQNVNIEVKESLGNGTSFAFNEGGQQQGQSKNESNSGQRFQEGVAQAPVLQASLSAKDGVSIYA